MNRLHLLRDAPASGWWNMAVDEWLLQTAATRGVPVLRFYFWAEPTLSIGYFQHLADRAGHRASQGCPVVRRASGGGAIVHDRELTYSLATPVRNRFSSTAADFFYDLHRALVDALCEWSVTATLCDPDHRDDAAFLCFQRRAPGDVVVADSKIAGSAQRRSSGSILQHGSILLTTSSSAPELAGIDQTTGCKIDPHELSRCWCDGILDRWNATADEIAVTSEDTDAITSLGTARFASHTWTQRR
ncbi:MAG: hypothetical protein CMJ59_18135 [Planctomycetaceae bacterium]|nr:hypothetical protein [Planctomycetaceae bacterium]